MIDKIDVEFQQFKLASLSVLKNVQIHNSISVRIIIKAVFALEGNFQAIISMQIVGMTTGKVPLSNI